MEGWVDIPQATQPSEHNICPLALCVYLLFGPGLHFLKSQPGNGHEKIHRCGVPPETQDMVPGRAPSTEMGHGPALCNQKKKEEKRDSFCV